MEILSMGGYGAYVWSAYALTFGVIAICILQARQRHRRIMSDIRMRIRATENRQ